MNELSMFAGCGGGVLASKLLGWNTIGYVEIDDYCQRILRQRINDWCIDHAPIFGDLRAFIRDGYAASYSGMVDVVSAGFPCQPFSAAGKMLGEADERNLWPETIEVIRIVRPRFAFLENVPALLGNRYFGRILGDLAESGYDVRWRCLSAAECGAPHIRNRLWILAHADGPDQGRRIVAERGQNQRDAHVAGDGPQGDVADTAIVRRHPRRAGDATQEQTVRKPGRSGGDANVAHPEVAGLEGHESTRTPCADGRLTECSWWAVEPDIRRVVDGCPSRMDRLKALGNAQVPIVAATAWRLLTGGTSMNEMQTVTIDPRT